MYGEHICLPIRWITPTPSIIPPPSTYRVEAPQHRRVDEHLPDPDVDGERGKVPAQSCEPAARRGSRRRLGTPGRGSRPVLGRRFKGPDALEGAHLSSKGHAYGRIQG
jgi:hypothetical protein